MHPLAVVAMVVAGAAAIARHYPPQPWEYRPAPHDRTKSHRHPGALTLAVAVAVSVPVTLYVLCLGHLAVAAVLSIYLLVALVLAEAQFLR